MGVPVHTTYIQRPIPERQQVVIPKHEASYHLLYIVLAFAAFCFILGLYAFLKEEWKNKRERKAEMARYWEDGAVTSTASSPTYDRPKPSAVTYGLPNPAPARGPTVPLVRGPGPTVPLARQPQPLNAFDLDSYMKVAGTHLTDLAYSKAATLRR